MRSTCIVGLTLLLSAGPAAAQAQGFRMPEQYRDVQVHQLEAQRRLLVAMADSMPQRFYRDKMTPIQRDFANQLYHAASSVTAIAGRFALNETPTVEPDTARIFNDPAAMIGYINEVYDWAIERLRAQSANARLENVSLFGLNVPRWQVWDEIHQHTFWTAGQIVANFRKHGMAPPGFSFF